MHHHSLTSKAFLTLFDQLDPIKQGEVYMALYDRPLNLRYILANSIFLKEKRSKIIENLEKTINDYLQQNNFTRTSLTILNLISNVCLDCDENHSKTHYPTLRFVKYLIHHKLFAEVVVNIDNNFTTTLRIEDAFSMVPIYKAHKSFLDQEWIIQLYDERSSMDFGDDITLFVTDITISIQIYMSVLGISH